MHCEVAIYLHSFGGDRHSLLPLRVFHQALSFLLLSRCQLVTPAFEGIITGFER